jgi:hypothetical protein
MFLIASQYILHSAIGAFFLPSTNASQTNCLAITIARFILAGEVADKNLAITTNDMIFYVWPVRLITLICLTKATCLRTVQGHKSVTVVSVRAETC